MSDYTPTNLASDNPSSFVLSDNYLPPVPNDSIMNPNAKIPTSSYDSYQYHHRFADLQSLPPPPPFQQHQQIQQQQYAQNTNYENISKHSSVHQTTLKLCQSQTSSYPNANINNISSSLIDITINNDNTLHHRQSNNNNNNMNINPQQIQKQKQNRRASQPHVQTMCYEPNTPDNSRSPNTPINYTKTKRELNQIRMKHYNQLYQINKTRNYHHKTMPTSIKKRRHSLGNHDILIQSNKVPISIQRSYTGSNYTCTPTSSLTYTTPQILSPSMNSCDTLTPIDRSDVDVNSTYTCTPTYRSNTSISRRRSNTKKDFKYKNKIHIKKRKKKNKIERTKSYDTSYDNDGRNMSDNEIIEQNTSKSKSKSTANKKRITVTKSMESSDEYEQKRLIHTSKKKKRKTLKTKKKKIRKKSLDIKKRKKYSKKQRKLNAKYACSYNDNKLMDKKEEKSEKSESDKQILRIRNNNKSGQRVVTFSRRKSLMDGTFIGFESPKTDYIPLMSPMSSHSEYLMDLQMKLETEKIKLENKRNKIKEKENKMRKECETLKKKYENEYIQKCKEFELKETEYEQKQAALLRCESENDVSKRKLLKKQKLISKQQKAFAIETHKFDRVISDFYFYQSSVNETCNKHIVLINKWMEMAQHMASNVKQIIHNILHCKSVAMEDKNKNKNVNKLQEYELQIKDISNFEEINQLQNELTNMPRPQITKHQSTKCEMRLQQKWRKYLSIKFKDEYINSLQVINDENNHDDDDDDSDTSDTQNSENTNELVDEQNMVINDEKLEENVNMNENENENGNENEININNECDDAKMIENIMKININNKNNEVNEELSNNNSFIRSKQTHHRSSASFIKNGIFADNINPFWSLQYDSGNEMDEMDLSRNSNSSAVIQSIEDIEDTEPIQSIDDII